MPGWQMVFPQTRVTLIQRLASGGSEEDWGQFLSDYWGPICRLSLRFGARNLDDAEDVASQTFEVLWERRLLVRWVSNQTAKLRTLLCSVVRNILSHRNRLRVNRDRLWQDFVDRLDGLPVAAEDGPGHQLVYFHEHTFLDMRKLGQRAGSILPVHFPRPHNLRRHGPQRCFPTLPAGEESDQGRIADPEAGLA